MAERICRRCDRSFSWPRSRACCPDCWAPQQAATCRAPGCQVQAVCRGLCDNHYAQRRGIVIWTCRTFGCANLVRPTPKRELRAPCCSRDCAKWDFQYRQRLDNRPASAHQDPTRRACDECGADAGPYDHRRGQIRCQVCTVEMRRALNRRKNQRRRGHRGYGRYTLKQIGDRDGWRCHLCRRSVDSRLKGPNGMAPSIDHLIPLAAGGPDSPENVALAHCLCNAQRRDGGEAQLRLVG